MKTNNWHDAGVGDVTLLVVHTTKNIFLLTMELYFEM